MAEYCNHCMNEMKEGSNFCSYCGKTGGRSVPDHHLLPGTVLNGKFLVGDALGEGGFGITYIGRDMNLDMRVAIKEFFPSGYVNRTNTVTNAINDIAQGDRKAFFEKGKERFLNEARALAKFSGEAGIVDVRDFFETNNTAYIIMEYLEGTDLKSYIKQNGLMSGEAVVNLLEPVMLSLKKVHAQGLIHRDISPDNIMILADTVKLLDFGAARNVSAETNKSLSVMLKPGYAPEEQYRSKGNQGPWTDVYALCATMYKCITGITPDDSTQRVFSDEVKTPSAMGISISPVIENAIMKGMAVHQQDRFRNVDELLCALRGGSTTASVNTGAFYQGNVMQGSNSSTIAVNPQGNVTESNAFTGTVGNPSENQNKKKSKTLLIAVIAAVAVVALVLVAVFAFVLPAFDGNENYDENDSTSDTVGAITEETSVEETETLPETTTQAEAPVAPTELSDDIFDFTFLLNGVVYQLPCTMDVFTDNGWVVNDYYSVDEKIAGNSSVSIRFENGRDSITLEFYNYSGNSKKISDCKVGAIRLRADEISEFELSGGLSFESSVDEIIDALGVPDSRNDYDDYASLAYYLDSDTSNYYNVYNFYRNEDEMDSSIEITNFVKTAEDKTETDETVPDYLSAYTPPTELGTDTYSGIISLEGELYMLPCPLSEFTSNGWEIKSGTKSIVSGDSESIILVKDDAEIYVNIFNFSDYQTVPLNCAVIRVNTETYSDNEKPEIILPGEGIEITVGMSEDDLLEIVTDDYSFYDGSSYDSYSYYDYDDGEFDVSFYVNEETRLVENISISQRVWDY